jgi:hypothetical protein
MVLLLVEEKLKEEELVKLLEEDIVVVLVVVVVVAVVSFAGFGGSFGLDVGGGCCGWRKAGADVLCFVLWESLFNVTIVLPFLLLH